MTEQASTGIKSILLADDEQGFRDLFHFIFEPLGYEVVTVRDGQEALDAVRGRHFDLVILDVHMPRMGGPEALSALREIRPDQRIIIVSSRFDPTASFEIEAVRTGVSDCLFKPMEIDELIAAVEKALRQ
ncbi:MAG: hypothetical protein A2289_07830 [Deltaproteobacteria bacterium RIFOXYA12_FULL_58_15]|nr:MAG: hypothetical protein A2289_07830 [Deltaproteobacteria bacterium RIFOXYA12_FULL_58_15]